MKKIKINEDLVCILLVILALIVGIVFLNQAFSIEFNMKNIGIITIYMSIGIVLTIFSGLIIAIVIIFIFKEFFERYFEFV